MKNAMTSHILDVMSKYKNVIFITSNGNCSQFNPIKTKYSSRYINTGQDEHFMLGCSSGVSMEGKIPICYFNGDVCLHKAFIILQSIINKEQLPVKIIVNKSKTNKNLELIQSFNNIEIHTIEIESDNTKIYDVLEKIINSKSPSYVNII